MIDWNHENESFLGSKDMDSLRQNVVRCLSKLKYYRHGSKT